MLPTLAQRLREAGGENNGTTGGQGEAWRTIGSSGRNGGLPPIGAEATNNPRLVKQRYWDSEAKHDARVKVAKEKRKAIAAAAMLPTPMALSATPRWPVLTLAVPVATSPQSVRGWAANEASQVTLR